VTLKTGVMMLKTGIKYILKYIQTENGYFKLIIFHNITVFTVFYEITAITHCKKILLV